MKKYTPLILIFFWFLYQSAYGQERTITGKVISAEDNLPLPGANIVVKGTTIGTITDLDGNFSLEVTEDANTLVISFVGMVPQEINIEDKTNINVTLQPDVLKVEEIVVTAIGIRREQKALGYAVQDIQSESIEKSNNQNVINALSGRVAGVQVKSSSGTPGASSFIEIRGAASLLNDNRPLFVIDGVPIDKGGGASDVDGTAQSDRIMDLNPDDIKSVSVLKGGAASALYGIRAANGAIIITTKKGEATEDGQVRVNVHSSVSIDRISQVPDLQHSYVQGSYLRADETWPSIYGGTYSRIGSPDGTEFWREVSWGPHKDSLTYTWDPNFIPFDKNNTDGPEYVTMEKYLEKWNPNGRIVYKPEYKDDPDAKVYSGYFLYDEQYAGGEITTHDPYDFFQTGVTFNNSINFSGGTESTNYYFSYSNYSTEGVIPNNTLNKNTFKFSGETEIFEGFRTSTNVQYLNNTMNQIQQGSNTSGLMLGLLRTPPNFNNEYGYQFDDQTQRTYRGGGGFDNPYWVVNEITSPDKTNRMIGDVTMNYEPAGWINLKYKLGTDWYNRTSSDYYEIHSSQYTSGRSYKQQTSSQHINSDFIINITRDLGEDFSANVFLGNNLFQRRWYYVAGNALGLLEYDWDNLANTNDPVAYEGEQIVRRAAFFGDLGFSYQSMLFMNFTARQEWSTTMPENNNGFFYPSVSAGFVFTEIEALKSDLLPFGKIRASYAITASDANPYRLRTLWYQAGAGDGWTNGIRFPFKDMASFTLDNVIGNNIMKPETQKSLEIGTNLRFRDNKFQLDLAYFFNQNLDLLMEAPIATSTGFDSKYMNTATMETRGFEISLRASVIEINDFAWNINANFANPETKVTSLATGATNVNVLRDIGGFGDPQIHAVLNNSYRLIYGSKFLTNDNGHYIIDDRQEEETYQYPIQSLDLGIIGKVEPDYTIGITNDFRYKNLQISALLDIKVGGQMWNGTKGALYYYGKHKDTETRNTETESWTGLYGHYNNKGELVHYETDENGDRIEKEGPGDKADVEVKLDEAWHYGYGPGSAFTGPQSQFIEDTDWFRLRDLTISYAFSDNLMNQTFFKRLEIYFTGKNLILLTPYTGVDPETSLFGNSNAQGIDYFNMPGTRTYLLGIRAGF